jgi:hypothetical protein
MQAESNNTRKYFSTANPGSVNDNKSYTNKDSRKLIHIQGTCRGPMADTDC